MSVRLEALRLYADDPAGLAAFWAEVLGRQLVAGSQVDLLPTGHDLPSRVRFLPTDEPRPDALDKVHLHLTSSSLDDRDSTVAKVLELGGRHLDVGQLADEDHIVLADPEGNAFCVIEPGNSFLAGCGFLGELACDGSRTVGQFWSRALGWPLVWDEDEETAIQSPYGGTKIAWGGPPVTPPRGRGGLHFDLSTDDAIDGEVERLIGLGATLAGADDTWTTLADPDGNTFCLRA